MAITLQTIESLPLVEEVNENTSLVGWDGEKTVRVNANELGGGNGMPEGSEPYKQLVTDSEGKAIWEDRVVYKDDSVKILWEGDVAIIEEHNNGFIQPFDDAIQMEVINLLGKMSYEGEPNETLYCEIDGVKHALPFCGFVDGWADIYGNGYIDYEHYFPNDNGGKFAIEYATGEGQGSYIHFHAKEAGNYHIKLYGVAEIYVKPFEPEYLTGEQPEAFQYLTTKADGKTAWENMLAWSELGDKKTIEWGGPSSDQKSVSLGNGVTAFLVVPRMKLTKKQLVGNYYILKHYSNGNEETHSITEVFIHEDEHGLYINADVGPALICIHTPNEQFTETGLYFCNVDNRFNYKITKLQYTSEVIHRVDQKYIPTVMITVDYPNATCNLSYSEARQALMTGATAVCYNTNRNEICTNAYIQLLNDKIELVFAAVIGSGDPVWIVGCSIQPDDSVWLHG